MKNQTNEHSGIVPYNECVKKAFYQILEQTKSMLATIEHEELRYSLERQDKPGTVVGHVIDELVNPLIYLRLEEQTPGVYAIQFGIETLSELGDLACITSRFLRLLYTVTAQGAYPVNIEACVKTNLFTHNVSGLYEYLEESEKYTFKIIPYKVSASKRKLIKAVA